jgi:branched-chain amino acid transport system permease protein
VSSVDTEARSLELRRSRGSLPQRGVARPWPAFAFVAAAIAAMVLFQASGPSSRVSYLAISIGIFAIAATGLAVLYGECGQMSVAHGALIGLGAYATIYSLAKGVPMPVAVLASVLLGIGAAVLIGIPSLRLQGHYFVITTFAAAEALSVIATNTSAFGRSSGLSLPAGSGVLQSGAGLYYTVFGTLIAVVLLRAALRHTRFGSGLVAIRENEPLARSLGVPTSRFKVLAFVTSGGVCGLAGFFFAFANQYVSPADVGSAPGITLVLILILGGSRHWLGPIVGSAVYFLLPYVFPLSAVLNQFAIGIALVVVVLVLPHGIVGTLGAAVTRLTARRATATPADRMLREETP